MTHGRSRAATLLARLRTAALRAVLDPGTIGALARDPRPRGRLLRLAVRAVDLPLPGVAALVAGRPQVAANRARTSRSVRAVALWSLGRWSDATRAAPTRSALAAELRARLDDVTAASRRRADTRASRRPPSARGAEGHLRVLHVVVNSLPHSSAGYALRTAEVVRAQREAGLDVAVATPFLYPWTVGRGGGLPTPDPVEPVDGVPHHRLLPSSWPGGPAARRAAALGHLHRLLEQTRPDVLHVHSPWHVAAPVLEVATAPVVYEVRGLLHETWAQRTPGGRGSERFALEEQAELATAGAADAVVTLGTAVSEHLVGLGLATAPVIVPNAVPEELLAQEPAWQQAADRRARLGVPDDGVVVGSVSSLVDYEGFDVLLEAASLAGARGPVTVVLAGDGDAAPGLRRLAERVPAGVRVIMPGRLPARVAREWVGALDVHVTPRRDVPVCRLVTPMKPAEAMAMGVPVVLSDLPALREFAGDDLAVLVPPEDPVALAEVIDRLRDPAERLARAEPARAHVAATRTWRANAARYLTTYRDVLR